MKVLISIFLFGVCFSTSVLVSSFDYQNIETLKRNADYIVKDRTSLIKILETCPTNSIIYIKGNRKIDLTGLKDIKIRNGLKLIGDRNLSRGDKGALLFTRSSGIHPLFSVVGDDVLIYGLRIRGEDGNVLVAENSFSGKSDKYIKENYLKLYNQNMYATPVSSGIATNRKNLLVENCELFQWTYTAIYVKKGASNIQVKNSNIHHNQRFGLGYGVTIDQGEAYITGNTFNYNRHSVASTGREGSIYIVDNNVFHADGNDSWAVDMHGGKDRGDKTNVAGEFFVVKNNTFYLNGKGQAVVIRGVPNKESFIENNTVYRHKASTISSNRIFEQVNSIGNVKIGKNIVR